MYSKYSLGNKLRPNAFVDRWHANLEIAVNKYGACLLTGLLAVAAPTLAVPGTASAQDVQVEINRNGLKATQLPQGYSCNPRYERCRDYRWDERDGYRFCSDGRALDKAERMGVRKARIVASSRRSVAIRGRDRDGDRVKIVFGRERWCPVLY